MDNKTIAPEVAGIIQMAERLVKKIETGNLMQVPEEKKAAFEEELRKSGAYQKCEELKQKLADFKTKVTQSNGPTNNTQR